MKELTQPSIFQPKQSMSEKIKTAHEILLCMKRNWHILTKLTEEPNISVTDLYISLSMEQTDVSNRLSSLREFDLVDCTRSGQKFLYSVTDKAYDVAMSINKFLK